MSLTLLTVTGGAHGWANPDGTAASGKVTLQPVHEAPGGGYIVVSTPETFPLVSGNISGVIASNAEATTLQYVVHEAIVGADNPRAYVVSPAGSVLDLSAAPRGTLNTTTPLYVLASTVGVAGGLATLDQGVKLALSQDRGGYGAKAGLLDPTVLTPYGTGGTVTLAAGTYTNKTFNVAQLIVPNNNTIIRNCAITCTNTDFGVRLDANTGMETGRLIEHCTITAGGVALAGAGFTARNVLVTQNGDDFCRIGRSHAEPTVIEDCAARDFRPNASAHADGVQVLTQPAADVIIRRCDISMNTASGYTLPSNAGYTGAIFVAYDVAVPGGDPEPTRSGFVWVDGCRLQSSGNYTIVIDQSGVDVSNCMIGSGFTAAESINSVTVTGTGNTDLTGAPLVTAIHSDCRPRYLSVGDPRQTGGGGSSTLAGLSDVAVGGVTNGQFLEWTGVHWVPGTPSGGGGGSTLVVRSAVITTGTVNLANTSGTWQVVPQVTGPPFEIDIPAVAGDWVEIDFNGLRTGTNTVDIAVIKGSSLVRFLATSTSTPASDGDVGWYDSGGSFALHGGTRGFSATSGDIDGGSVRFVLVTIGGGSGSILATSNDTFYWQVKNYGPHT